MKMLGFAAKLHNKEPQHWAMQYREALADEAHRARAEASRRVRVRTRTNARAALHS